MPSYHYHLTTTANPLRTQPHSQSESVHNSGDNETNYYWEVASKNNNACGTTVGPDSDCWSFTTPPVLLPDLQAGGLAVPGSGVAGGTILTDVVISNGGTGDAGPFSVSYLYTQNAPDLSSAIDSGSSCDVPGLAAGANILCSSVQVNVPLTLAPGTYRLAAVADYADVIEESRGDENNISISSEITIAPPCFLLTRTHTGAGRDPTANPASSSGCSAGTYHSGEQIQLTASPGGGWQVGSWTGTSNDGSSSLSNSLVMPSGPHATAVHYVLISVIPNDLVLSNDTISQPNLYEACNSITLGPGLFITAGAPGVTLRAPTIVIVPESGVLLGALVTFHNSAPAGCP